MPAVCFYFQVHQPYRLKRYRVFDIGYDHDYFSDRSEGSLNNQYILSRVARKCYLPANATMLSLIKRYPKQFKISYSLSGVFLEQLQEYAPDVLESFQMLVDTGQVEFLGETYYHSLSFLYSRREFEEQVAEHSALIKKTFGKKPTVFRNTELIYSNEVAKAVEDMGFKGILAEGADHILGWRSPNFLYRPVGTKKIKLFLKNFRLSDDIAFRFSSKEWPEYPLTADRFAHWVSRVNGNGNIVNLFMDYETFGEHQWEDTGIFQFMEALPEEILKHPDDSFITPSEAVKKIEPIAEIDYPHYVSWADTERDLSAWLSNSMQHQAIHSIYSMEDKIRNIDNPQLTKDWRKLQTSDHYYYMCTKWFADGDVHKYFSPYESPYEAFISCMNAIHDLTLRIDGLSKDQPSSVIHSVS